ncbi:MAG: hypothetical protein DRR19_22985 [Candidatus Parabeggiatoa sp. nov. 1]|nr:MAG: hypothetical protein DRR19_22985 [Gammaproteobacteria bacterium]
MMGIDIDNRLIEVIEDYLYQVKCGVERFQQKFGISNVLQAYRQKIIPKSGWLSENLKYDFHGVGCFLIYEHYDINFDFGPNGRCDGFDEWRIYDYLSQNQEKYPYYYLNNKQIKEDFKALVRSGIIYCPRWEPSRHLYYYTTNTK